MLRHLAKPPAGVPMENTFQEYDPLTGEVYGDAVLYTANAKILFPKCPNRVMIQMNASPVPDALIGAVLAKARSLAADNAAPTRVYTQCDSGDEAFLQSVLPFGFVNDDALIRMQLELPMIEPKAMPDSYTIVQDLLLDPHEREMFLKRYNQLYDCENTMEWLDTYTDRDRFHRFLAISREGLAGELTCWMEERIGFIGYIYTKPRCRHLGIGSALVAQVCEYFFRHNCDAVEVNVQRSISGLSELFAANGFSEKRVLACYPGFHINPKEKRQGNP